MMNKIIPIIFLASCFLAFFSNDEARAKGKNYPENTLLIKLKPEHQGRADVNFSRFFSLKKLNLNHGLKSVKALSDNKESPLYGVYELTFSQNKNIPLLAAEYQKNSYIKYAEPDYQLDLNLYSPNDTYYSQQWNLAKISTPQAWAYDNDSNPYGGSSSITVAVVDTGVAYENYGSFVKAPDLSNTNFSAGYDFVDNDSHPNDDDGHGTSIAEIIAASTNNSKGIAGIAFNVSIMPIRVIEHNSTASAATVAQGIDYAVSRGADIINISLGGETTSEILYDSIKAADQAGVIIVASTGNDGDSRIYYPAAYPEVISVGSTNSSDVLSSFSNYGEALDLVAPGQGILAEYCANPPACSSFNIVSLSGTSQAAPHVSAAAALLLSNNASASRIKDYLINSADDLGAAGYDTSYGYGRLDAASALALAQSDLGAPTTVLTTSPAEPNGNNGFFTSYPRIYFSASDENGVKTTYYRLNSGSWQTYTNSFRLTDGKHLVEYYSKDNLNNTEVIKSTYIYVDTVAPNLTLTRPYSNQKVNGSLLKISGTYGNDTSGIISFTAGSNSIDTESTNFSENITLSKGQNNLNFVLTDRAGNTKIFSKQVFSFPKNNILVGMGPGELPRVRGYNSSNQLTGEFLPYLRAYSGGVNVIGADINNDGQEEIITAPIRGGGPHVRVLTGRAENISNFMAYLESFRGGVNIAAGDVDGDGQTEIITAAGPGGGPHIRVFDYQGNLKYQFFAYLESFRGGVQVASGDTDGDGIFEIITAAGIGGGPHVRVFDYQGNLKSQFMAYAEEFRGGVNIATGDLDSDGIEEIITSPLSSGGPHVRVFDYQGNLKGQFFVYSSAFRGGLNVSAGDYDNDGTYEIICGVKSGLAPEVKIFDLNGELKTNYYPFWNSFSGGITVAGFN